jgi:hypothetical protein
VGGGIISDELAGDFGRKAVWDFFDSIYPISDIPEGAMFRGRHAFRFATVASTAKQIVVMRAKSPPLTSSNSDVDLLT